MISREHIERLYDAHAKELYVYILRYVRQKESAEDLLQDTFARLIAYSRTRELYADHMRALLYSIARTQCIDFLRGSARKNEPLSDNYADTRAGKSHDDAGHLDAFLDAFIDGLSEPEKTIILLRRNGVKFDDIARSTGLSLRTVKRKTAAVLMLLQKKLGDAGFLTRNGTESDSEALY